MESPAEYWEDVARLRGEQVAGLTSGNRLLFMQASMKLEALAPETYKSKIPTDFQRQQLRDALTALVRIVEQILEQ